ncbi:MAG: MFS transporter [Candidatus Methylacidiphilaceae bacterium]
MDKAGRQTRSEGAVLRIILLFGAVSLFADMTYEGARSILGPFLGSLGASGAAVGLVAGMGELAGYGLRFFSGILADRTRSFWRLTFSGYGVNLAAVPLLGLVSGWPAAAALVVAERLGKAIRTPARDVLLATATRDFGRGRGFGIHEAMDQVGAVLGPLSVALVLACKGGYRTGFLLLALPALLSIAALGLVHSFYGRWQSSEPASEGVRESAEKGLSFLPPAFWSYLVAVGCVAGGYIDFALVAFHAAKTGLVPPQGVPLLYALAMGIDAGAALWAGRLFDRKGFGALRGLVSLGALAAPFLFLGGGLGAVLAGVLFWGIGMGVQESVIRAAVAELVPHGRQGTGYGLFNMAYGFAWFGGSALMGLLYDRSPVLLVAFSCGFQLLALPLLTRTQRQFAVGRVGRGGGGDGEVSGRIP